MDRTHARTEYPKSSNWVKMWKPMKPEPPVTWKKAVELREVRTLLHGILTNTRPVFELLDDICVCYVCIGAIGFPR